VDFAEFKARALAEGASEVIERVWPPHTHLAEHTHPFTAQAVVVQGEMWLTVAAETQHLLPGDTFNIDANVPHAERYGPQGATYWVARRT
jgi:quercetin dioxygenase-like cupin family protein